MVLVSTKPKEAQKVLDRLDGQLRLALGCRRQVVFEELPDGLDHEKGFDHLVGFGPEGVTVEFVPMAFFGETAFSEEEMRGPIESFLKEEEPQSVCEAVDLSSQVQDESCLGQYSQELVKRDQVRPMREDRARPATEVRSREEEKENQRA